MTTRGFHSVAERRDDADQLIVRARGQADIAVLSDLVADEPVRLDDADYAWRVETTRDEWQAAMQVPVAEITYPNFESAVHDPENHDACIKLWGAMLALDDR